MTSRTSVLPAALVLFLAACQSRDVVAKVDGSKLRVDDFTAFRSQRSPRLEENQGQVLDALIDRQLLAQGARGRALQEKPEVAARLRAVEREVLAQALVDEAMTSVTEAQVKARFEASQSKLSVRQLDLAHIFIATPKDLTPEATRQAQSRANAAWARLLGGDDFAVVAHEVSEDPATADRGGNLGTVREGQVSAELFLAAAELKPGTVSKPISSGFGLHILKALSPIETKSPRFEDVKGMLLSDLQREAQASLLERLKKELSVERFPERLNSAAVPTRGTTP